MEERFTIADVAAIHGINSFRNTGGEFFAECPFCGNKKGKFSYILEKGNKRDMYHCWSCGEGGGAVNLHMELSGITDYMEAVRDIFTTLNDEDPEVYRTRTEMLRNLPKTEMIERASDEHCSAVYYCLLSMLTLRDEHKEDLLRRGLTEEDIKRYRFRSTPERDYKVTGRICRELINRGFDLNGVPGFYIDRKGRWQMKLSADGYFCPVFDGDRNLITGFQIRNDDPDAQAKYIWFSSSGCNRGASSGALCTYLPGKEGNPVIVVEGILKALVVYCLLKKEITIAGVPGVKAIKGLDYILKGHPNAVIVEAYDMDKAMRTDDLKLMKKTAQIAEDAKKLADYINNRNFPSFPLVWDMDKEGKWLGNYKGLDDFLFAYGQKEKFITYIRDKAVREVKLYRFFSPLPKETVFRENQNQKKVEEEERATYN